ncbi:response regulator transcription factor [Chloroflexota bacterium]
MHKKILLIDNDSRFLRMVEQVLSHKSYDVLTANSGHEGLRMLFDQRPDLVILDVVMPKMNGWQTCERIRDISDIPNHTYRQAGGRGGYRYRTGTRGADDYLVKTLGNK